jgi:Zn-dependent protease with chaperone function
LDFYSRQAEARRQSRWLLLGFLVSVALVVVAIDIVVVFAVLSSGHEGSIASTVVVTSFFVLAIIVGASLYRTMSLRDGGGAVARALGGTRVDRGTDDPLRRRLLNIVEEMSIASGVPMPEVYVLDDEEGINAFAAGHAPANAAVAVTHGALKRLSRDQLQGVIAHEFSHVLNGDMALNIRLMGWLFGLLAIATIGRFVLRHGPRGGDRKGGAAGIAAVALAVMVLGYVGLLLGRLLQAAVSRQREKLADASAVQFTRNADGLKGALLKIAGVPAGSTIVAAEGEEVAHMLFASGFQRWFATHPPLIERIQALDPRFRAEQLEERAAAALSEPIGIVPAVDTADLEGLQKSDLAAHASIPAAAEAIAQQVGHPETVHVAHARTLSAAIPAAIRAAAATPERALPVVLASLLSPQAQLAEQQRLAIERTFGAVVADATVAARSEWHPLSAHLRLPAVQLLFPTLRRLTTVDRQSLVRIIDELARMDARIDVFECALGALLAADLREELRGRRLPSQSGSLAAHATELATVFGVLARQGVAEDTAARRAYEAGMGIVLPRERPPYSVPADWAAAFVVALTRLESLHPYAKRVVVEGLVKTIAHDEVLSVAEAELLRTVCAIMRCPLPPLLPRLL